MYKIKLWNQKTINLRDLQKKESKAALEKLELIKNLSNTTNYDYSKQEADKIVKALTQSVSEIKKSFDEKTKPKFKI